MWSKAKHKAAPIYQDELQRRAFATASGKPKGAEKLKKLKAKDTKRRKGLRAWLFGRGDGDSANAE